MENIIDRVIQTITPRRIWEKYYDSQMEPTIEELEAIEIEAEETDIHYMEVGDTVYVLRHSGKWEEGLILESNPETQWARVMTWSEITMSATVIWLSVDILYPVSWFETQTTTEVAVY